MPGDFILTHGSTWQAKLIQFGQGLRFRGDSSKYAYWNHAAIIVSEEGGMVEALNTGVKLTHLSSYELKEYVVVRPDASDEDKIQMANFAMKQVGKKYGWLKIVSLAGSLLTGLKFNFGIDGQLICSGLVAYSMFKGRDNFDGSLDNKTPADLAQYYNIEGRGD
jgi:uncharacterized protein YycO